MTYTPYILFALGCFGILLHNLIKMDSLNRKAKGEINYLQYLKLEKFSILISVCVVFIAMIAQQEITKLNFVSEYLGLAFVAIGYMAQSIIVTYMGRAESFLHEKDIKEDK